MSNPKSTYGFSTKLSVMLKPGGGIVLGGISEDETRWLRVLSHRAAQVLRLHLTQLLYPDKSDNPSAGVMTAPIRDANLPTVTSHVIVGKLDDDGYELVGMAGRERVWLARLADAEARNLCEILDKALFPADEDAD